MNIFYCCLLLIDITFSNNGCNLVAAITTENSFSSIYIWQICKEDELIKGNETLTQIFPNNNNNITIEKLLVICYTNSNYLMTLRSLNNNSSDNVNLKYCVEIWNPLVNDNNNNNNHVVQSIIIEMPIFKSKTISSSLLNTNLECALSAELTNGKYIILSSRFV